ncbi:ATP-binding protein [Streptomyces sp. NPDC004065]|uniref:ATP-binding protein n=1 Tax=Streptomyces sp. NPDC004065 TaxID=3364689 RepID=UPI00384B126D
MERTAVAEHGGEDAGVPYAAVDLDGGPGCIARARRVAAAFLGALHSERGRPVSSRVLEGTQLVVSELVTNAVKYAPGPLRLELRAGDGTVDVTVCDGGPALPAPAPGTDPGRVGRHGLEIVRALAQDFSVRPLPTGKRVTARIALTDGATGR